jgi:hypothetical protein
LIAVGFSNGRTILSRLDSFSDVSLENQSLSQFSLAYNEPAPVKSHLAILGEFNPKHARACNVVEFSPGNPRMLLSGLDKARNDFCLFVWDVERMFSRPLLKRPSSSTNVSNQELASKVSSTSDIVTDVATDLEQGSL